jgi:predicted TPR repeat methyltransferase
VDDGYIAYDTEQDALHWINATGALILELCDGRRTVEGIEAAFLATLELPEEMGSVVKEWLKTSLDVGLISFDPPHDVQHREMDTDLLTKLARRLRKKGSITEALVCQRRAAELAPDDPYIWSFLGELAHIKGERETALKAYKRYLELEPDDAEVGHIVVALSDGPIPERTPDDCILQLYSRFSSFYNHNMREELDYRAPELLMDALAGLMAKDRGTLEVLDLGCGTGLAGEFVRPWARSMYGVDLSPHMVELARNTGIYDELHVAEVTTWLRKSPRLFDLVIASDLLVYFGDLTEVMAGVSRVLATDGLFAFTVEQGDHDVKLTDSGRYSHNSDYVRRVAQLAGFDVAVLHSSILRMEYRNQVIGLVVVLRKTG